MEEKMFEISKVERKMHSIGIDISLIESLVKSIDISMNDEFELSSMDIANLTIVLKRLIQILKKKYDNLERTLNI